MSETSLRPVVAWTFVVTSVAAFMVALDNLVVTTALPTIRHSLHAGLSGLEWTINAYTLTFAVLLLTGAALGDRFGRRRVLSVGMALFTASSAGAALAPSTAWLVAARAAQGVGAALVLPLTLTILSAAVPASRRGAALGVWGAMAGLAVAVGPVIGGAVTQGLAWQWIFWLNVPIGLALLPMIRHLDESVGPVRRLDLVGVALASLGLLGVVLGLVRGNAHGWTSAGVGGPLVAGALVVGAFLAWERRAAQPMLPLGLFGNRGFSASNAVAGLMSFGMFGSVFLLAQFLQTVQGYSPLQAGLRTLPWTAMPMVVAPLVGPLSDRIGGRPLLVTGLGLQAVGLAWMALVVSTGVSFLALLAPFVISGVGMALFFVPIANVVFSSVRPDQEGIASGANNSLRELGGVFGIAVLASVFSARGGYTSGASFVHGLTPALWVGTGFVVAGFLCALAIPRLRPSGLAPAPTAAEPAGDLVLVGSDV